MFVKYAYILSLIYLKLFQFNALHLRFYMDCNNNMSTEFHFPCVNLCTIRNKNKGEWGTFYLLS